MCPFCLATVGLIVAGAASAGGLTAFAVKVSRNMNGATEFAPNSNQRRNQDVNEDDRKPKNSFA
jgi:hypothetical protein